MESPTSLAAEVGGLIVDLRSDDRHTICRAGRALTRLFDARVPRVLPFGPADRLKLRRLALAASDVQQALLLLRDDPKLKQSEWVAAVRCQCGDSEGMQLCEAFAAAPRGPDVDEIAAYSCCMELGRLGSPDALDALARLVKIAERPGMRLVAAECLAPHGRHEGQALLRKAFDKASAPDKQLTLAMHLTRLGDAEAGRFVIGYLQTAEVDEPLIQQKLNTLCGLFLQGVLEPVDATPEEIRAWANECAQSAAEDSAQRGMRSLNSLGTPQKDWWAQPTLQSMRMTEHLRFRDRQLVWHPFTAMSAWHEEDFPVIAAAEGFHLIDTDGRRYLDGHSSLWCNVHGHRVPAIDAAIRDQLDRVAHTTLLGLANLPSIELAGQLVQRAPASLTKVFFADCGAAGVEVALKMAWQYHRQKPNPEPRDLFVCLSHAYHGDTVGTVSVGGIDEFHSLFGGLLFPTLRIPTPATPGLSLEDCLRQTEEILSANADRIAGVIVEPLVQAAAGILVHPRGYLSLLRQLTERLGLLLIADEIAVGFGRLGTLFACEQEDVNPDILILSKGLTGGYLPLAATLTTDEIYEAFLGDPWSGRTFYHGHTYTGNPLACAAALASLTLLEEDQVLLNAREIERVLAEELTANGSAPWMRHVGAIRHRGTMVGIDLALDPAKQTPFPPQRRAGHAVMLACRERGVILRNIGDTVVLYPAPAMPVVRVRELCRAVRESLAELPPSA